MTKRVNFEDNIYVILARIRLIRDLLLLDADPEIFLDKTLDDFAFIDGALDTLLTRLLDNQKLIKRDEFLNHVSELELLFGRALNEFLESSWAAAAPGSALRDRVSALAARSRERRERAEDSGARNGPGEPVVGADELSELLKDLDSPGRRRAGDRRP